MKDNKSRGARGRIVRVLSLPLLPIVGVAILIVYLITRCDDNNH